MISDLLAYIVCDLMNERRAEPVASSFDLIQSIALGLRDRSGTKGGARSVGSRVSLEAILDSE